MSWGTQDTTDQMPTPASVAYFTPAKPERRDALGVAAIVLFMFLLSALSLLFAMSSLVSTIDRLMAVPMCVQEKTK